jgi:hypothetical protein
MKMSLCRAEGRAFQAVETIRPEDMQALDIGEEKKEPNVAGLSCRT